MKRIVFILNDISHPHCHKRITEFINNGYSVDVYGFVRKGFETPYENTLYKSIILTSLTEGNYISRIFVLFKQINRLIKNSSKGDAFYIFGLDIVMIFYFLNWKNRKYVYEELDLSHTYVDNKVVRWFLEKIDLTVINHSLVTIITSEGFAQYHFGKQRPSNIFLIPNKLNPKITEIDSIAKKNLDINHLQFGFVGAIRFKAIYAFADYIGRYYPQHTFHFYGACNKKEMVMFDKLKQYPNVVFHGVFSNPNDLPAIYSNLDFVISTYDTEFENVRYAEPNKIYEAIYFDTPIIVSDGTFLADKVKDLGIGLSVDVMNGKALKQLIDYISEEKIRDLVSHIQAIPKSSVLNQNSKFFSYLSNKFKK